MKYIALILFGILLFSSCNNSNKTSYTTKESLNKSIHPGKKLMETNCNACHSSTATEENRIAPPMIAIKRHYIKESTTKEDFINKIQSWIKNPNIEDAKMFGAVKRFGVMPKTYYPETTIKQIADYMFDNDIEQPEWFEEHFNKEKGKNRRNRSSIQNNEKELSYKAIGLKYALSTKAELGKNLIGTIQKKGTVAAVTFCNKKAYVLTDSMSKEHNAIIKRVSDKPRNENNKANLIEIEYIESFKKMVLNKEEIKPIIQETEDAVNFYFPIKTNAMCLQCHGKLNEQIGSNTYKTIKRLYPNDLAVGYGVNEVRGIWSINFKK